MDFAQVHGTGIGGAIELADVEQAAAAAGSVVAPAPPEDNRMRMRRAIAAAMSKSKREIPHYYLSTTIEMTRALDWLAKENSQRSVTERLLIAVLQLKAVALALRDVPELNGYWKDEQFQAAQAVNVGLAISMKGGGLVAPAVHDTDRKSLVELMATLHDLIPRARAGRLRSSEMTDATVTLTNLGDLGVESVYGVFIHRRWPSWVSERQHHALGRERRGLSPLGCQRNLGRRSSSKRWPHWRQVSRSPQSPIAKPEQL